jgi:predicted nucleic acid-binding protein
VIYWDTSALVKLYVPEPDSHVFLDILAGSDAAVVTADIASVEVLCTLHRKEAAGDLRPNGAEELFERYLADTHSGRIMLIPNGRDITTTARRLVAHAYQHTPPLFIRSLDALHIASAIIASADAVIATDKRLRDVATLMGLAVLPEDPNG